MQQVDAERQPSEHAAGGTRQRALTGGHSRTPKYSATAPSWLWNWYRLGAAASSVRASITRSHSTTPQSLVAHSATPSRSSKRAQPGAIGSAAQQGKPEVAQDEQEHRMRAEHDRRHGNRDAMRPIGPGTQRHQAQHQQRAIKFQMQRPERRVERMLHRRQACGDGAEQRRLAIAEQQAVEPDLAREMQEGRRAAGIHRQPGGAGERGGLPMRRRQPGDQRRGDGGRRGHRDAETHHTLRHLGHKAPGRAKDGVSTVPLIRKNT